MGTLSLTDPVNGTTADASVIATNNAAIKTVVNGGIDNTNIASGAAIAASKLAGYPNDVTKALKGDGSWATLPGSQVAFATWTGTKTSSSVTQTSSVEVVAAPSFVADGTSSYLIDFFAPQVVTSDNFGSYSLILWDGGTNTGTNLGVIGQMYDAVQLAAPVRLGSVVTPSAATKTYSIGICDGKTITSVHSFAQAGVTPVGGTGTLTLGFIRITKV